MMNQQFITKVLKKNVRPLKQKKIKTNNMTQEERTQLIREIKELLQMDYESKVNSRGSMFDDDTLKLLKSVLQKCLSLSI
jgi:hypothetical protein